MIRFILALERVRVCGWVRGFNSSELFRFCSELWRLRMEVEPKNVSAVSQHEFCHPGNIDAAVAYLSQELTLVGLPPVAVPGGQGQLDAVRSYSEISVNLRKTTLASLAP